MRKAIQDAKLRRALFVGVICGIGVAALSGYSILSFHRTQAARPAASMTSPMPNQSRLNIRLRDGVPWNRRHVRRGRRGKKLLKLGKPAPGRNAVQFHAQRRGKGRNRPSVRPLPANLHHGAYWRVCQARQRGAGRYAQGVGNLCGSELLRGLVHVGFPPMIFLK